MSETKSDELCELRNKFAALVAATKRMDDYGFARYDSSYAYGLAEVSRQETIAGDDTELSQAERDSDTNTAVQDINQMAGISSALSKLQVFASWTEGMAVGNSIQFKESITSV